MMRRDLCFLALSAVRADAVVVATYTSAFEWEAISPSPLNYVATGAMGQAPSHALGLALGLPERKIIVLDGDGGLLMNLGSLVTIAAMAPKNLYHFVNENGTYEANGGHPLPNAGRTDFCGFARAAGYAHVLEFSDLETFTYEIPGLLALEGPVFTSLKITPGEPPKLDYRWMHGKENRQRFKDAIRPRLAAR
jgi:phosphonopyruvate decarboxylase